MVGPGAGAGFVTGRGRGAGRAPPGFGRGRGRGRGRGAVVTGGSGAVVGASVAVATDAFVATITERRFPVSPCEVAIATAAPPAAIRSPSSAGQIQSPGYHGSRLRHAW